MENKEQYQTRALVPQQLVPQTWQMIEAIAPAMYKARLFGVSSPEQAMAIMLKGYELGLSLTASFELVQVVQGRTGLSPRGCLALIQQSPLCEGIEVKDQTDKQGNPAACTVTMRRVGGFEYTVTVTMEDAQRAGLVKPQSGWEKWPANMLRWRAVGFCADVVFPDVIGGMKRSDELGADITPEGDVIEGEVWAVSESVQESQSAFTTIDALLSQWTPEAIMEANEGKIPATEAECLAVAEKLEG